MTRPAAEDMQCEAITGGATKGTPTPDQCEFLRIEIPDQRGVWSKFCTGHRAELVRMRASGEADSAPGWPWAIRTYQTKREAWVYPGRDQWKPGDPL